MRASVQPQFLGAEGDEPNGKRKGPPREGLRQGQQYGDAGTVVVGADFRTGYYVVVRPQYHDTISGPLQFGDHVLRLHQFRFRVH